MFKILQAVYDRVMALKNGLTANLARWAGQPDTPDTLDALLKQAQQMDAEIKAIEVQLHDKREAARKLADQINAAADQTERRASGIHAADTDRLADYNIPVPGAAKRQASQVPEKAVVRPIEDDDDGQGFIVRCDKLDADHYEWERSEGDGPLTFLRTTTKIKFVDDDVKPNVRYHYRARVPRPRREPARRGRVERASRRDSVIPLVRKPLPATRAAADAETACL